MSEMVKSAIVGEAVSRVFSGMIRKYEDKLDQRGNSERLEMAQIKLEAAVEMSTKWQVTDVSLLRWRRKLKRASQECSHTMHECKRRSREDQMFEEQSKQSSFPRRIIDYATKSFMSSVVGLKNDDFPSKATVQRFERLADGANDFLRYIQLGGTPRKYMFFDPLIKHLFAGKYVQYEMWHLNQYHYFGMVPVCSEGRGLEAKLAFWYDDYELPENSFRFGCMLRLSESTYIIGITVKCLQLVTPHFKSVAEVVIKELIQLPTQDFFWLPCDAFGKMGDWNHVHNILTQYLRPDPFCCQGYDLPVMSPVCTGSSNSSRVSGIFPEPVGHVYLHGHLPLSDYNNVQGPNTGCTLKLGVLFAPHDGFESTVGVESSATETIDGEQQHGAHFDTHLHDIDEMLLPKAINYLSRNARATTYRISWKSRHGSAHLCVEKTNTQTIIECRATTQGGGKSKVLEWQDWLNRGQWKQIARDFLKIWGLCSRSSLGC